MRPPTIRSSIARLIGRLTRTVLRSLGLGGTTLPGLIATRIDRRFLSHSAAQLETILISGTNGKTTTTNQLVQIVKHDPKPLLHNHAGSNLTRGIASTLLFASPHQPTRGVLEVDEAELRTITNQLKPKLVVLLNLFRDQMDRYGEIDKTAQDWQRLFQETQDSEFLLNADDPSLGWLGYQQPRAIFFGISHLPNQRKRAKTAIPHTADTILSPLTGEHLIYHRIYFSHLGEYGDPKSNFRRPPLDYAITHIELHGLRGSAFHIQERSGRTVLKLTTSLPGIYNIYNVAAAAVAALRLGQDRKTIEVQVANFHGVFGRFETITLPNGRQLIILLAKNPVGFNLALSLIQSFTIEYDIIFGINDRLADGLDVSWLWDVDFEHAELRPNRQKIMTSGTRAHEMALRLKYSGNFDNITVMPNWAELLDYQLGTSARTTIACLTYSAMLEFRALLTQRGLVPHAFKTKG